jgi:hypothetical protein
MKWMKIFAAALLTALPAFPLTVGLQPSLASPQPLGTPVTWTASPATSSSGAYWYRFRTRYVGVYTRQHAVNFGYHTVVDYGPNSTFTWTTIGREGPYEIEVSVRDLNTGETGVASATFVLTPLADSGGAVLTATANPLVYIYSAPGCRGRVRVQTVAPDGSVQSTPFQTCDSRATFNSYVAGMRPNTSYTVYHEVVLGASDTVGPQLALTTAGLPIQPPQVVPPANATGSSDILLHSIVSTNPVATDMQGNIVWYAPFVMTLLTRPAARGTFVGINEDGTKDPSWQVFRHFDLSGATLAETNAARVSEQLAAMGMHPINSFHHEAIQLPDGKYLVLAGSERILTDVQGAGPVDVLGDTIIVLDPDLNVVWAWDAFDHLDPHRQAILAETCTYPATAACSNFYLAKQANDWLHGNALQLTPDGNIIYSVRHQDWVVKIDYQNGAGSGDILWRMGVGGDFQVASSDPYPWFSHQHDSNFLADGQTFLVFDNGNTRIDNNPTGNSRAQVYQIDEANRSATPVVNTDLGVASSALGTAEALPDGSYHFDAGFVIDPAAPMTRITQVFDIGPTGAVLTATRVNAQEYRNFRMTDLYTPPVQWVP